MKKAILILMCMAAMMMAGTSLKAQEITIVLNPGWTWISCPSTDTLDFTTAFGSFTPAIGDIIKSKWGSATYTSDYQWRGSISQLYPGYGYHYKSNRTEPVIVTFNAQQPAPQVVVTTLEPADITTISTIVGGTVTLYEGNHIYACGVCWDTVQMPTVDDNHTSDGTGTGVFSTMLTELTPNTTYYVRAYVVTDYGLAYGEEQNFTTIDNSSNVPEGAINGLFTINANGDQVYFSQGNLQYQASTNTWRFAENQWDYVGTQTPDYFGNVGGTISGSDNANTSSTYNGWIDLFCWGTSGYNHGANCYQPWSTSTSYDDYYAYGNWQCNLNSQTGLADWGYNPISNGGNIINQWRTLTTQEWQHMFNTRTTNSGIRYAKAKVNNVNGVVLLPDNWSSSIYNLSNTNNIVASFSSNILTDLQWTILENAGAIFLPATGYRYVFSVYEVGSCGRYWSASYYGSDYACIVYFYDIHLTAGDWGGRCAGISVRLVHDY